jgi:Protein of unknown function (DUF1579)
MGRLCAVFAGVAVSRPWILGELPAKPWEDSFQSGPEGKAVERSEYDGRLHAFFIQRPALSRAIGVGVGMLLRQLHQAGQHSRGETMKASTTLATFALLLTGGVWAADVPQPPKPQKEHEWLKQLEGEWVTDSEAVMGPGQPPVKCKGTESVRSLGGFFTIGEMKADFMGTPVTGIMTIGYDPKVKKYVGSWVCSMDGHLWKYEGSLDATGKTLTLNTEGPDMSNPGKMCKMKDVIEIKDKDHKVLTSWMQGPDGGWVQFMTMHARRK